MRFCWPNDEKLKGRSCFFADLMMGNLKKERSRICWLNDEPPYTQNIPICALPYTSVLFLVVFAGGDNGTLVMHCPIPTKIPILSCLPPHFIISLSSRRWWCILPSMSVSSWPFSLDRMAFIMAFLSMLNLSLGAALPTRWSAIPLPLTPACSEQYIHVMEEICKSF